MNPNQNVPISSKKPLITYAPLTPEGKKAIAKLELSKKASGPDFEVRVSLTFKELETLLLKKHKDYGPKNISEAPGGALNGLLVRMHDKMARIKNLHYNKLKPSNESLEDSFKDLANYAIIGLLVLREEWDK